MMRLKAKYLAVLWVSVYRSLIITTSYLKQHLKIMLRDATQEQYNKTKTEQNKNKLELHWRLRPMWTQIFGDVKIWYTGKYFFPSVTQNKKWTVIYVFFLSYNTTTSHRLLYYSLPDCARISWLFYLCVVNIFFCFFFTFHLLAILNKANINSNKLYWVMYWGSRLFKASEKLKGKALS